MSFKKGNKIWLGRKHSKESIEKMKKHNVSKETREKISKALKGRNFQKNTGRTHFKKGSIPWNKGKERPEIRGKNHPNWKNGIYANNQRERQTFQYAVWRDEVYRRDKWTCRLCKKHCQRGHIVAHHIQLFSEFPELRFSIDNGITLCRKCHIVIHYKNGEI